MAPPTLGERSGRVLLDRYRHCLRDVRDFRVSTNVPSGDRQTSMLASWHAQESTSAL